MTTVFTLCSNNYLAHAKTAGDSYLDHHPGHLFIIGLVDEYDKGIDYSLLSRFTIIPVKEIGLGGFEELNKKYTITELNTAVKPAYFHHIFNRYQQQNVIYLDPDILVMSTFFELFELLEKHNIVITPHICSPIDDAFAPTDYHTLRGGIFNLGFIGLSNYSKVLDFLNWWHERVIKYGFADFSQSMFYDQLWINYVPVFYDNYYILKHPGYNMANWNLHERVLTQEQDTYYVNQKFPLRFFHFSSYKFNKPEMICAYLTRYTFDTRPDLKKIFDAYRALLLSNSAEQLSKAHVYYFPDLNKDKTVPQKSIGQKVFYRVNRTIRMLIKGY